MPDEWIDVRTFAREVPNCEGGLVACGGRGCGANDASCVACWKRAGGRQFGEHTTEAWTDAGDEELRVRFLTDGASVHPGHFEFEAEVDIRSPTLGEAVGFQGVPGNWLIYYPPSLSP